MPKPNEFLATLLKRGSHGFAGLAATELLDARPEAAAQIGTDPATLWTVWFAERVEELAVAVAAIKSGIFVHQVRWAVALFVARGVRITDLKAALESLRKVLQRELPPAMRGLVDEYLCGAFSAMDVDGLPQDEPLAADTDAGRLAASYLLALLQGDRRQAISTIQNAAASGWRVADLYSQILVPAQREVGRMWLTDEINVAEEHLATATTKMIMSQLRSRSDAPALNEKTVVAATVPEDQHDVGLQMVADFFEMNGWRTIPLGASVPTPDLLQAVEAFQADLLVLSASLSKHLLAVRDTIFAVHHYGPSKHVKILVGGPAFIGVTDLAERFGADGYAATASDAVQLGNHLVGLDTAADASY